MFKLLALCCLWVMLLAVATAQGPAGKVTQPSKASVILSRITKEQASAKTKYLKIAPKHGKAYDDAKAYYIEATLALANFYMEQENGLRPNVKYPRALHFYREVLKTDPKNKQAKDAANMIVAIYKSMGRKVPGEG